MDAKLHLESLDLILTAKPTDEVITKQQLDFMNEFGVIHHVRNVPKCRDFDPRKVTAVVVHALQLTRRCINLFLLRLRRFVVRMKRLARWFRRCLQQRELALSKVLERWVRLEDVQRKAIKSRIYRDCKTRKDACRGMIETYVSKLNISAERKKLAVQRLYWERSVKFREEFRTWSVPYNELKARKAKLLIQRRSLFDPVMITALDIKVKGLQAAILKKLEARPKFPFDESSITLSDLVEVVEMMAPPRVLSPDLQESGSSPFDLLSGDALGESLGSAASGSSFRCESFSELSDLAGRTSLPRLEATSPSSILRGCGSPCTPSSSSGSKLRTRFA
eukprot:RCo000321